MLSATMEWTTVEDWLGAEWPGRLSLRRDIDGDGNAIFEARAVIDSSADMVNLDSLVFAAVGNGESGVAALRRCWEETTVTMHRLGRERLLSARGRAWLEEQLAPGNEFRSRELAATA
jgi:hypothetical protein